MPPIAGQPGCFRALRKIAGALASVLFPAPCRICGNLLENASRIPVCELCLASLKPWNLPQCARCGRPFASGVAEISGRGLCHGCRRGLYDFDFARSYGPYSGPMARAILMLKYERVTPLADWFAERLQALIAAHRQEYAADVVVPVPLHRARQRERGYNQAELIAQALARRIGLPCRARLLIRTQPRPEKLRLTVRERWRSVRNAFDIRETAAVDKLRILLLDDVLTTGATLDACSRTLREGGAESVAAITVARAMPRSQGLDFQPQPRNAIS